MELISKISNKYCADLETTTDILDCRAWVWGITEIGNTDYFIYDNDLESFMRWCKLHPKANIYFHNLKFDGEFLFNWFFKNGFTHSEGKARLKKKQFSTLISNTGQFYSCKVCFDNEKEYVTFYDSLKIIPFSVKNIALGWGQEMTKGEIDYNLSRPIGYKPTLDEIEYLRKDIVIVANALITLFDQGLTKITQGSNALFDYKRTISTKNFDKWFPPPIYDGEIRESYKGGFTYLNPIYKNIEIGEGIVLDVNSLYPYVMYSQELPYGEGIKFNGKYKTDENYNLYVQTIKCHFELKENHIPMIQIKGSSIFVDTEYLTDSNDEDTVLTLTNVDLELFYEHYNVYNEEYLGGWKFKSYAGFFKEYIDKWITIKIESEQNGNKAMRTLAKLMLNALYGKFATNPLVQSKIPFYDNEIVKYKKGEKEKRKPIYIPMGTFITSYARSITIKAAQAVLERFIYADTDSLHLVGKEIPKGLNIHKTELGAWKNEGTFTKAKYLGPKCYIEYMLKTENEINEYVAENSDCEHHVDYKNKSIMNITVAGLPERCYKHVSYENFKYGACYKDKLMTIHCRGGIILKENEFTIKVR